MVTRVLVVMNDCCHHAMMMGTLFSSTPHTAVNTKPQSHTRHTHADNLGTNRFQLTATDMFANPSRQPGNLGFDPLSLSTPKNRYKYELAEVRPTLTRTMNPEPAIMRLKILQSYMCQLGEAHAALEVSVRARDSGLRARPAAVCVCAARSQQAIACARRDAVTLP